MGVAFVPEINFERLAPMGWGCSKAVCLELSKASLSEDPYCIRNWGVVHFFLLEC